MVELPYERVCDAPDVYLMRVPFTNLSTVAANCYLVHDEGDWLLVDAGASSPVGRRILFSAMQALRVDYARLAVFLTHQHFDHAGLVSALLPAGTPVYASALGCAYREPENSMLISRQYLRRMLGLGVTPDEARSYATINAEVASVPQDVFDVRDACEGDRIRVGRYEFAVLDTAGHAPDHLALYQPDTGIFFGGDHVLYVTTPSVVTFADSTDAMRLYLDNLEKVRALDVRHAFLGHGDPVAGPITERIDRIIERKKERMSEVTATLRRMPYATCATVARHSCGRADHARWMRLPAMSRYYLLLEAFVIMQHLCATGCAERMFDFDSQVFRYKMISPWT